MPAMPRVPGKATNIAYAILGKPANLQGKKTPQDRKVDEQLLAQNTSRMR